MKLFNKEESKSMKQKSFFMGNLLQQTNQSRSSYGLSVLFIMAFLLGSVQGWGQTTVIGNPGTGSNDTSVGNSGVAWNNPGNCATNDNVYSTLFVTNSGNTSNYLKVTNFGFSIPSNATIVGISVAVSRFSDGNNITDNTVKLIKAGSYVGNVTSTATWPTTETTITYGSSTNLWGQSWTPSDINNSSFGFALRISSGTNSDRNLSVDSKFF